MHQQRSFALEGHESVLYLVPTPIGNLEDMTYRAIRILKEADVIAAEDTRNTKKLCNYFEIDTPIISYHEHNKEYSGRHVIERILDGQTVALVSDAGMPAISDPGFELVRDALEQGITVIPLPGANAALTALIASGIQTQPFYFYGFLDRNAKNKKKQLEKLKRMDATVILYESPHRLKDTLAAIQTIVGNRRIVLCRELTKKFEEFIRGSVDEIVAWSQQNEIRGEFCLIMEGASEEEMPNEKPWWEELNLVEHVNAYMQDKGLSNKEAIKETAKDRGLQKRNVYHAYHIE
ncbi:16S rRNA (cytidine(1402)-2'-O)-methyltransferase [Bacillus testis]|uniref:16S rRNA (cytidine(1402)-2'-O)-methyltransferase n=1 Tax=Bacillus testis TaxID=1622072 RepID=UPI00067EDBAE|nr:16S rRNA (cytidine(1402)-2'-O)-methyltransferase [Bacillus testis]